MNKIREVARLVLTKNLSNREMARYSHCSYNSVRKYKKKILQSGLAWDCIEKMDDSEIETLVRSKRCYVSKKLVPNWDQIHQDLQIKHVTKILLWEDYRLIDPANTYSYSQFTHYYREYVKSLDVSMRQTHRAGEIVFVDFAGRTIPYTDIRENKEKKAQIFVGVLGCSNYTFVLAVESQSLPNWIEAHNRMFAYFGCVPQIIVTDNLKSAVTKAGSQPVLNRTYMELAKYYGSVIVTARVRHPQDKAKVEVGVQLASRWIIAKLRNMKFFSVAEINDMIRGELNNLNDRPFKKLPDSRSIRFRQLDKPAMLPLPPNAFSYAEWTAKQKVPPDYHVYVKGHYYSVPNELIGSSIESCFSRTTVEIYHNGRRVATHKRSFIEGEHTTNPDHQTKSHRKYSEQSPDNIFKWSSSIGESASVVVRHQFESQPHQLLAIKACVTLQRLAKDYGNEQFENACHRARSIGSLTVTSIRSILQRKLSRLNADQVPIQTTLPLHNNVRGSSYYSKKGK